MDSYSHKTPPVFRAIDILIHMNAHVREIAKDSLFSTIQ